MKRIFDILISCIGLILFLPIFAIIAIINVKSYGQVFIRERRIGRSFRPFTQYKFRTTLAEEQGEVARILSRDKVTGVGKLLRRTKIEEIPLLWNVLKGDMSLVGPRPVAEKYVHLFKEDYNEILKIRPGITDIFSATFNDGEFKKENLVEEYYIPVLMPEKLKLAREYVRKASFKYDLKLIILTLLRVYYPYAAIDKMLTALSPYRRPVVVATQIFIAILANYFAFLIRFEGDIPASDFGLFLRFLPLFTLIRFVFLFAFRLEKGLWRYASIKDLTDILVTVSLGTGLFFIIVRAAFGEMGYPQSIYFIDWMLNVFILGGVRLFRRIHTSRGEKLGVKRRVMIIGAGDAAEILLRDIEHSPLCHYNVIGLIDDNPQKRGLKIRNIMVMGTREDLPVLVKKEKPEELIIVIPSASQPEFESIVLDLRQYGLPIKTVPSLGQILSGNTSLAAIKAVEPEDILFRAPVNDACVGVNSFFAGKRVMITGAGGSIGAELARQIAASGPDSLVLFERHEENLYRIDLELKKRVEQDGNGGNGFYSVIGDILDEKRLEEVMGRFRPEVVLHAAAYKHVPLMEENCCEAFKTNVNGTRIVAEKAAHFRVERFVLISTDKAVNPVNVMGMTKKVAEGIIRGLAQGNGCSNACTKYIIVRFGNVLDSSGSVVPLFREQIRRGGPVTVTHPEVTRYFMTIPEAVSLVLQATAMGQGGEVFVLDMGKPVKILDLAKRMISLYGYRLGVDMDLSFIGLRPGEKLYEELFNADEVVGKTCHPKIYRAIPSGKGSSLALEWLTNWEAVGENSSVRNLLLQYTMGIP
jgi:FlaA1/EpsC-like NDP-sugar epimerase/lipopolysaccharide/colanic/teichoic acid biosynthesis glycosyltransferase